MTYRFSIGNQRTRSFSPSRESTPMRVPYSGSHCTIGAPVAAAAGLMTAGLSKITTCWSVTAKSCMTTGRGMSIGSVRLICPRGDTTPKTRYGGSAE